MLLRFVRITKHSKEVEELNVINRDAFPPDEYISTDLQAQMSKHKGFDLWAIYDGDVLVGFTSVITHVKIAYVLYLAVAPEFRSKGYGSKILADLKELYPNHWLMLDMEKVDENAQNYQQRKERQAFYMRNGYRSTGYTYTDTGVVYEVYSLHTQLDYNHIRDLLSGIKIAGFNPQLP